jgi:hypothetical protein
MLHSEGMRQERNVSAFFDLSRPARVETGEEPKALRLVESRRIPSGFFSSSTFL